eukprot:scaffold54518_cov51-Attheya_sp.AAC.3
MQERARAMMSHQEKEKVNKNQRNKQWRQEKYRGRTDERKHIDYVKSASFNGEKFQTGKGSRKIILRARRFIATLAHPVSSVDSSISQMFYSNPNACYNSLDLLVEAFHAQA